MDQAAGAGIPPIDDIIDNFALLDEWDDRYRYVIELGRGMDPLPDIHRCDANKVPGCASQVWLGTSASFEDEQPVLRHLRTGQCPPNSRETCGQKTGGQRASDRRRMLSERAGYPRAARLSPSPGRA